jgi:hypothetical protein
MPRPMMIEYTIAPTESIAVRILLWRIELTVKPCTSFQMGTQGAYQTRLFVNYYYCLPIYDYIIL